MGPSLKLDEIWFTRCPVPTATGIAADLGWFDDEFGPDRIGVRSLQDVASRESHFDHGLDVLVREGGNVPALWARARGAETALVGLTWIDERQAILTRADDGPDEIADLRGKRVAAPSRPIAIDFWRAMALHGFSGALRSVGLGLGDVELVDVVGPATDARGATLAHQWAPELQALQSGRVDAVYVKGAVGVQAGEEAGARALLDLDLLADRRLRVNNGTPRPITVHRRLLQEHPDIVKRFLAVLLRAADWAAAHPADLRRILADETGAGTLGVQGAYRGDYHLNLHPDLSDERLGLLDQQQRFLFDHGFIAHKVDVGQWADPSVLDAARELTKTLQSN